MLGVLGKFSRLPKTFSPTSLSLCLKTSQQKQCIATCGILNAVKSNKGKIQKQITKETIEEEEDPDFEGETDPFLKNEIKKYNVGKRWLAKMMGADPDNFTQKDIDESLQYLLPSHLFAKDARPQLKHPHEVFPVSKESEFDETGRPYKAAFYTGKPNFYDLTFKIWQFTEELNCNETNKEISAQTSKTTGVTKATSKPQVMQWMKRFQLEQKLNEKLNDNLYDIIMFRLKKLSQHPKACEIQEFLSEFQVPVYTPGKEDLKEVDVYQGAARAMGYRKTAIAEVIVREGSGRLTVNDTPMLDYFTTRNDHEQVMFPLLVINELNRFDIEAHVIGGGNSGKSGAIRLGMSRAIASLCPEHFETLNNAKLLIRDYRQKERKKPGRKRARRGFQWVKR